MLPTTSQQSFKIVFFNEPFIEYNKNALVQFLLVEGWATLPRVYKCVGNFGIIKTCCIVQRALKFTSSEKKTTSLSVAERTLLRN